MSYWARRHSECVRWRNWNVLERTLLICKTSGPSDCCGSSEEGANSEEDTGEDTYVDEFSNADNDSDSEGDVEKRETTSVRMLLCSK